MANKKISELTASGALSGAELVEVSKLSATVTITASTISAASSDNSYNDSANGFVAAGFAVGNSVRVAGFTGNVANNINSGRVTALTAGKMTIGGADGDVIVTDAAGESVTITKWDSRRTTAQDLADLGGGGGGGGVELKGLTFTSDTGSTADSDPGAGLFKWNNATQASATVLYFDNTTADGVSLATFYASLGAAGFIYLQQGDDATKWQLWKWTALPVDGTGYRKFTVALQASGGSIADNKTVYADFSASAAGGDVTGPGSSTDNALPRFDGTGGKTLQASGVLVSDADEISGYKGNINAQTGTTYTLVAADSGKVVELTNASPITLTMPNNLAVGFCCTVVQGGAGTATFTPDSGATRRNRQTHTKTAGQWAMCTLYVRTNSGGSAAEWVLGGDTAA